jgi:hypothetical protein
MINPSTKEVQVVIKLFDMLDLGVAQTITEFNLATIQNFPCSLSFALATTRNLSCSFEASIASQTICLLTNIMHEKQISVCCTTGHLIVTVSIRLL